MGTRLLASIGESLAARGQDVTFVCCRNSETERELALRTPALRVRPVSGAFLPLRVQELRGIAKSLRPDAVLVDSERDALTAALAVGRTAGVVRRLAIGERFSRTWAARLTSSRSRYVLMGDEIGAAVHVDTHVRTAVAWPNHFAGRSSPAGESRPESAPVIAIVAGDASDPAEHAAGAAALRASARILTRHPGLQVVLLGRQSSLQAMRVHAGAVGLAERLVLLPLDALLSPGAFAAAAVWVTSSGDEGAVSVAAAMMRRIPVIVPRGFDIEGLVAQRITGFVADDTDLTGSVASLAHLMADAEDQFAMGAAAAARAARLHDWDAMLSRTLDALSRVAA